MRADGSRRRRDRATSGAVAAALAVLLSSCGSAPAAGGDPSSATSRASSGTIGAPDGSSAATGAGLSIPVQTVAGPQNQPFLTTQITVGGGAPATVWLDTGSSGLIMDPSAVGPQVTKGTQTQSAQYESGDMVSVISTATVGIGSATTAQPIAVGLRDDAKSTFQFPAGTVGIMGIGTANTDTFAGQALFAPQLQLPAPLNAGSTLQAAPAGQTGTWTLGPVAIPEGAVTLPLPTLSGSTAGAPAGYPSLERGVPLCWTVGGTGPVCGPTDVDAGSPSAILTGSQFSGLAGSGDLIAAGTPVSVGVENGATVWSFTAGSTYAHDTIGWVGTSLGAMQFNAGLGFLIGRTVAWDYPAAQVFVGPAA